MTTWVEPISGQQVTDGAAHARLVNGVDHVDSVNSVAVIEQGQYGYETVAAGAADQVLGGIGAVGDLLHRLICIVVTPATSQVQIKDGAAGPAITVLPSNVGGGIGVYSIELNAVSSAGGWRVTTAAGVSVIAIGRFEP